MTNQTLPCCVCGKAVMIAHKKRFLYLVREGIAACCEECRAYISPGIARDSEGDGQNSVYDLGLRQKRRRNAKRRRALASMPLGRCVISGCEPIV